MSREMVFNEMSIQQRNLAREECAKMLAGIATGIGELIVNRCAQKILRLPRLAWEVLFLSGFSLQDVMLQVMSTGTTREEGQLLLSLAQKAPLVSDLSTDVADKFHGSQATCEAPEAAALVLCVASGAIAVSFPSAQEWDQDWIEVSFSEICVGGTIDERSERIDNLAQASHARSIIDRFIGSLASQATARTFWTSRSLLFPNLAFGLDVKQHTETLDGRTFALVMSRLAEINLAVHEWSIGAVTFPTWRSKITPESQGVMLDPRLRGHRMFRDSTGTSQLYEWHARCGGSFRIHFRIDEDLRLVEVGYVGHHLPL